MKVPVRIKAGARQEKVEKLDEGIYLVWVRAPAREGKANEALKCLLSEHFGVSKTSVEIVSGQTSRNKIVEIAGI